MSQGRTSNTLLKYAVTPCLVLLSLLISLVLCASQTPQWRLRPRQKVGMLDTVYTAPAYYVPRHPQQILVLAHGYPWPDETASDETLGGYARADVERWAAFAETRNVILLAPAFGGRNFPHYWRMLGRLIRPDQFIDELVDGPAARLLPNFSGRFNLHGHSAGAQFAARYLVVHPDLLDQVILSAPSTYPMPDLEIPWPYGMGRATVKALLALVGGKEAAKEEGARFVPIPDGWIGAATRTSVTVLVGSRDTERRPPTDGQQGSTRIQHADSWVKAMQQFARSHNKVSNIHSALIPGLDRDEAAMAMPAQKIFAQRWDH
jgi:pimeloyl-ACP methyl ester carboxylesterase